MVTGIILVATVILLCVLAERFSGRVGMPALLLFMGIGMLFGSDGIVKIAFADFEMAEHICTIALIFIMFYGGFNTKWKLAKKVAGKAVLLSTAGVIITAGITALLCYFVLHFSIMESFLVGAVLSSTDAASVFSILRQKKLNLKDGTASLLEIESGSNDPIAYMLTLIGITLLAGDGIESIGYQVFAQLLFGAATGVLFALATVWIMTRTDLLMEGLDTIFMIAMVLLCCGVSECLGGNLYLSVYLMGIIVGNSQIRSKAVLIPFFDGITNLMHILIFFLLGLLAFPHKLPAVILPAVIIAVFLTVVARPVAVFVLLKPLGCSTRQCLLTSWAGLRGAASSVFATMVAASGIAMSGDIYHIVFTVSLFSVAVQGTLLPMVARKLDMIDEGENVWKTFNDYQEEAVMTLVKIDIPKGHNWQDRQLHELSMPTGFLALTIRRGKDYLIPRGDTKICAGDQIVLNVPSYESAGHEKLKEIVIGKSHKWCNKAIAEIELPKDRLIAMIMHGEEKQIPDGSTVIKEGDTVILYCHTEI